MFATGKQGVDNKRSDIKTRINRVVVAPAVMLLLASQGCASKKVEVWEPKPLVHWEQVCTEPIESVVNGYRILVSQPTQGLFPTAIAVTRVGMEVADQGTRAAWPVLLADPRNELLRWNSALDDQMAVSEVFPIRERDLGGGEAVPAQILAAFHAFHVRLGLVYAVNELSRTETEMFGVIYDTMAGQPVATLHAHAVSICPDDDGKAKSRKPNDLWKTDSQALVRAEFESLVHACIRDLIRSNEPAPVRAPTGWTPAGPTLPVEWPPRVFRTGR